MLLQRRKRKRRRRVNPSLNQEKKVNVDKAYLEKHPLPYDINKIIRGRLQDNSHLRNLGDWKDLVWKQTNPPIVQIADQFPNEDWPINEI